MKTTHYALAILLITFCSCKKESSDTPGVAPGTATVTPTPPPPGFTFPKSYTSGNAEITFNVWVDDQNATPRFEPEFFFKKEPDNLFATATVKFINANTIEFIDGTGQNPSITAGYFFFRDTLFVVNAVGVNDTTPFATGNYKSFVISGSETYISGKSGNPPSSSRITADNLFAVTYQQVFNEYVTTKGFFSELDTVAIRNRSFIFR